MTSIIKQNDGLEDNPWVRTRLTLTALNLTLTMSKFYTWRIIIHSDVALLTSPLASVLEKHDLDC